VALRFEHSDEGAVFLSSGWREQPSGTAHALVGRAATFRIEAEALRARAHATDEPVIRDHYLALAQRWSTLATGLEAETLLWPG
jgi:hypothetical protein